MGFLYYGNNSYSIEIDDRPLAHLRIALLSLLRAGKSVAFGFERPMEIGGGRETLWISPSSEIRFRFVGSRPPRINEDWLREIVATADSPTGLRLVAEAGSSPVLPRSVQTTPDRYRLPRDVVQSRLDGATVVAAPDASVETGTSWYPAHTVHEPAGDRKGSGSLSGGDRKVSPV